ncbi:MAG: GAF domain-containing protein, partial [Chloroflexota bacterium]
EDWPDDPEETLDQGISGQAVVRGEVVWTGDYLHDERFPHGSGADQYVSRTGINSVMAAPLIGDAAAFGALTIMTDRPNAWAEPDGDLLEAIANQTAITITTARLIEALDRSREALTRRADAEQTLREIAARLTAIRDPGDVLRSVAESAARLVEADGAILDVLHPEENLLHWAYDAGIGDLFSAEEKESLWIEVGVGATGVSLSEDRVIIAGSNLVEQFPPSEQSDLFFNRSGYRSMIAAPISGEAGPLGVLEVYSRREQAFSTADGDLILALASQAAIAITNARLIEELARSREELARRADSERTLREIAARVSAILEPDEVLQRIVDEAARLLESDGARIDLYDEEIEALRWSYAAGDAMAVEPDWARSRGILPGEGVSGLAFAENRPILTSDYAADDRFHAEDAVQSFIVSAGIRSVISAPLPGEGRPLGVISVVSREPGTYDDADAETLTALATQAAIAITNARRTEELARSRAVITRRAEAEQALREIAARITAIREPGDLLQHVTDEAARLLRADGVLFDSFDEATGALSWAFDAGIPSGERENVQRTKLKLGEGVSGQAVLEQRVIVVDDYLTSEAFVHEPRADEMARASGIRSLIAAPIVGEDGPFGAIEVFRRDPNAFDEIDAAVLGGLADQAAVAITNARLIEELAHSREEIERRADRERALREIAARITAIREPGDLLQHVVDEALRLLGSLGSVIDLLDPTTGGIEWGYSAGVGPEQRDEIVQGALGDAILRLAITERRVIWSEDYPNDPRFEIGPEQAALMEHVGMRSIAIAPLITDRGAVGTLSVYGENAGRFGEEEAALLGVLADQAAIAVTNARLIEELERSQAAVAHRADTERSLRDITARITAIREHDEILARVVDEAKRLLVSDGAHLTRISDDRTYLSPVVVAGTADDAERQWFQGMQFPVGGGINGLAAEQRRPVWTRDYTVDPRIPLEPDDLAVADRLGL